MKNFHKNKPVIQEDLDNLVAAIIKGVNALFTQHSKEMNANFTKVNEQLEEIKFDVRDIKRRVKDLEGDTASVTQVVDHERRIKKLESHVFATT